MEGVSGARFVGCQRLEGYACRGYRGLGLLDSGPHEAPWHSIYPKGAAY
jgi:hypothetical protein